MQRKPSHRVYSKVYLALTQLLPEEVDSRLTNMAFLMIGIFGARRVLTGRLAAHIPVQVKKPRLVRGRERFWITARCGCGVGMSQSRDGWCRRRASRAKWPWFGIVQK